MACSPNSPNDNSAPRVAMPRILPRCIFLNLVLTGNSMMTSPCSVYVLTEEDPLGCISLVEPHLDSDTAELDKSRLIGVGYVSLQGLKRHTPFTIPLGASDLGSAETATALNLDTACASSHCTLDDLLHRALIGLSLIHISEPTRLGMISYAVFCLKKKKTR